MEEEEQPKSTAAYYLPQDVIESIEQGAKRQNRSASNFLATFVRKIRDANGGHLPD